MTDRDNDGVFICTRRAMVPYNVVRVRIHPSVTIIPHSTFCGRKKLEEVEFCEGLLEIGLRAFYDCDTLQDIKIPASVKKIGEFAFYNTSIHAFHLPEGIENICHFAFASNKTITNFRVPPLIVSSPGMFCSCIGMFSVEISESCKGMFSLELPETVTAIKQHAFSISLRNIALGDNYNNYNYGDLMGEDHPFQISLDLGKLLGSVPDIINALKHRFDNLPIHKMIYYQSYNNMTVDQLNNATDIRISQRRSKINPSGSRQDCLGMTPLHIMACSTVQSIELYKVLVDKYPETLVTEDRWGALPLLYAVWGQAAPDEVMQYLVESYQSIHPNHQFNWTDMIKTLSEAVAPVRVIQCLIDLQEESFPGQFIKWEEVLNNLGERWTCPTTFGFLVKCSIAKRVNTIGLKQYRDSIMKKIESYTKRERYNVENTRREFLAEFRAVLRQYEIQYQSLKEATTMLELVLWKKSICEVTLSDDGRRVTGKRMFDETDRSQGRVNFGADFVIQHVLPYLLPPSST